MARQVWIGRYRTTRHHRVKSAKSTVSKRDHNHCSENKRLLKRKIKSPRALINTMEEKQGQDTGENTGHVLREIQVCQETPQEFEPDGPLDSSLEQTKHSCLATDQNIRESDIREPPVRRVRPLTALTTRKELKEMIKNRELNIYNNSKTSNTFLTDGIPVVFPGQRRFTVPRHPRNKTAPPRHLTSVRHPLCRHSLTSESTQSECSSDDLTWYFTF